MECHEFETLVHVPFCLTLFLKKQTYDVGNGRTRCYASCFTEVCTCEIPSINSNF